MFQPKIKLHSIKTDATEFYLSDITGNFGDIYQTKNEDGTLSGDLTNDWGWGGDNPLRDSFAVIIAAVHRKKKENVWIDPVKYNPLDGTVEKVAFPYALDGHHEFFLFDIPAYIDQAVYDSGDLAFFPDGNNKTYMGVVKELLTDGNWKERSMEELAEKYDSILYRTRLEDLLYAKAYLYFGEVNDKRMDKILSGDNCDKKDNYSLRREYELNLMLRNIKSAKCNGYFILGEAYTSAIEKFTKD